jgi:Helix-turn-helix.
MSELTSVEKIRTLLKRRKMSLGELADKTNQSRQNLSNKFSRDNLTETDIKEIADVLNCDIDIQFIDRETGKLI